MALDSFTVAIEGFGEFERATLASVFRLAAQRRPAYALIEEAGLADFVVADADHPAVVSALKSNHRTEHAVFVGRAAPPGAIAWLPRPVDPLAIVRELDALAGRRLPPVHEIPATGSGPIAPVDLARLDGVASDASLLADVPAGPRRGVVHASTTPLAGWRGGAAREVLVVDDSPVARQFLQTRLQRLGYRVQTAASGEDALDLLDHRWFPIVFLDVALGGPGSIDGLQVCRHVKARAAQPGGAPTAVVLATGASTSSDRVRGSLAGCDAYLAKPLMEREFIAALRRVDPAFEWRAEPARSPR